tara:strand:+ start:200 stop:463 length:264 start_codon:yes stop_codon:yes gene_type:complete
MNNSIFTVTELTPLNRKSFYGKALAIREGNITSLKSYNTIVATYNHKENKMIVNGWYSSTTARHINSFLNMFGFDTSNKKGMENYNC